LRKGDHVKVNAMLELLVGNKSNVVDNDALLAAARCNSVVLPVSARSGDNVAYEKVAKAHQIVSAE
jgi:hypothetical protein